MYCLANKQLQWQRNTMTPKEALEVLKSASGLAALNRNDHVKVLAAAEILEKILQGKED